MKLLAIDTSSVACSVALHDGSAVHARHEEREREHTRLLPAMIQDVLRDGGLAIADLDAVVLGNGPGSFIGMRIAASMAQGLACGAGFDIVPVSSLAVVAAEVLAESEATEVVVAQDAHMGEVYLGAYSRGDANMPEPLFAERLHRQELITEFAPAAPAGRLAAGYGWQRYPDLLASNSALLDACSPVQYPNARFLLPLGAVALQNGASVDPQDLMPAYLRGKVAEVPNRHPS